MVTERIIVYEIQSDCHFWLALKERSTRDWYLALYSVAISAEKSSDQDHYGLDDTAKK